MSVKPQVSDFRIEKARSHATIRLSNGDLLLGCFFVSSTSPHLPGRERVGELLNSDSTFVPFEVRDEGAPRIILVNRAQVLSVELAENEAKQDIGYNEAVRRVVSVRLSNGHQVVGTVRIYRPVGSDRLSDWARQADQFRYIETDQVTVIVNVAHVIDASEIL